MLIGNQTLFVSINQHCWFNVIMSLWHLGLAAMLGDFVTDGLLWS